MKLLYHSHTDLVINLPKDTPNRLGQKGAMIY